MMMRKAETNLRHRERRYGSAKLTILELRSLLLPYNDNESADVVLKNNGNRQILERWYQSLHDNFRKRSITPAINNAMAIKSIERPQLKVDDSISGQFCLWDNNPETFWWPKPDESPVGLLNSTDAYRKFFTISAIHVYKKFSTYKVLWRFTTVAVYLHFRRWKPEIDSIRKSHVQGFLRFLICDASDDATTACLFIIKAGKRRVSFCHLLARSNNQQWCDNDVTNTVANEDELFRSALGIFFYDIIPDSIWDTGHGLVQKDYGTVVQHLHSIKIMTPPKQYDTFRLANKLLDYQSSMFWPNESERQISLEQCQTQTQMTATEAAGMLSSLATSETTGYHAMQRQPACELPRAGNFPYTGFLPTANHTQNAEAAGFNGPPFANTITPVEHHAGFTVDPGSSSGLQDNYQGNYDATSLCINPNSLSLTQNAYLTTYGAPCQTAHEVDIPINPESFTF